MLDQAPFRPMAATTRVLIADDYAVVREGVKALIARDEALCVVGEAADGDEGVALHAALRPDVTLMDLRMGRMDGVTAIRAIVAEHPAARVVVLTSYEGNADIHRALSAGACGYLVKDTLGQELVRGLRAAAAGRRVVPRAVADRLAEYTPRVDLTAREVEVLRLVAKGLRNKEVARVIGRAEGTVKVHLKNILEKLGVDDRTEAVTVALQRGIIHLDD